MWYFGCTSVGNRKPNRKFTGSLLDKYRRSNRCILLHWIKEALTLAVDRNSLLDYVNGVFLEREPWGLESPCSFDRRQGHPKLS